MDTLDAQIKKSAIEPPADGMIELRLGRGEPDEQDVFGVGVWRFGAELVVPQRLDAAGSQFFKTDTDRLVKLPGSGDELGVTENNLPERVKRVRHAGSLFGVGRFFGKTGGSYQRRATRPGAGGRPIALGLDH